MIRIFKSVFVLLLFINVLPAQNLIDGIAAVVGKEIVLRSEIEQYVNSYVVQNRINTQANPTVVDEIRKKTLESLIEQKLMLAQAEKDTITVDPELVEQRVDQRIQYLIERVGSESELEKTFQSPMKKIRKDTYKILHEQLLVEKVRQEKFQQVQISRREVEDFYNTYQDSIPKLKETVDISHILKLVTPSNEAQVEAFQKISDIKKQLDNGADFAELAKKYSDDPASAKRGGDLGLISRGDFVNEYETAAFALNDGEMSGIVQTQFGYHIIKMIERRGEKIRTQHILIRVVPTEKDAERVVEELKDIRQQALDGADFSELAIKYSDDENVTKDKGHLGTFEIDQMVIPQFKDVISGLKEGEISQPFKTDFGYHIVKLEKRSQARTISLDDDWQKIKDMAQNFKTEKEYRQWIADLKKEVPIEIKS
ncbi:MAG: peptidylprolyl isomerase [Calditrichae bacterium]|nr:peptidylprolyl isomerase [Calditrichota bacterium]MCB9058127.1 peptidylprolyl isomerase [Calditrichia bacterium]